MMERVGQVDWVLDHLVDIDADFRAVYRITPEEAVELTGPHFLALCWRLPAYSGVMAARLQAEEENGSSRRSGPQERTEVPSTPVALAASPMAELFEFGTG